MAATITPKHIEAEASTLPLLLPEAPACDARKREPGLCVNVAAASAVDCGDT
jgi:hypothetical protein